MKKTALIILNYNNSQDTRNCIESILQHNTAPVKIIVVDNNSSTDEQKALKSVMSELFSDGYSYFDRQADAPAVLPDVCMVETHENIGYARGNNVGLLLAEKDSELEYVMILNNDILFVDDIIPSLISRLENTPDCAVISPVLYKKGLKEYDLNCARRNVKVSTLIKENFLHYLYVAQKKKPTDISPDTYLLLKGQPQGSMIEIELPSGSCMLIKKSLFQGIGYFDPNTFLYSEENILYKRIERTGMKNYLSLTDRCIHLGASTTSNMPDNKWLVQQAKNSELYYVQKYSGASGLTKAIHSLSVSFYMMSYTIQKKLKKAKG